MNRITAYNDSLRKMSNTKDFSICYLKSTYSTRMYFAFEEPRKVSWENCYNYKTILGCIDVKKCENSDNMLNVYLKMIIGKIDTKAHEGYYIEHPPLLDVDTLLYECDKYWYEYNKDKELVKYFIELQNNEMLWKRE